MEIFAKRESLNILLVLDGVDLVFLLRNFCYSTLKYFGEEPTDYPPRDYAEINGILKGTNFLYEFQKEYIRDKTSFNFLIDNELKRLICNALQLFSTWKMLHREKEIAEHEGNVNWGSALPYTKWEPADLNTKFMEA